jgi:hypothetical protein
VYADQALSGASRFRPAFQQMQADAEQRRFDVIVVEALDRLSTASARLKWGSDQTYGRVSTAVGRRAGLPRASVDRLVVTRSRPWHELLAFDCAPRTRTNLSTV